MFNLKSLQQIMLSIILTTVVFAQETIEIQYNSVEDIAGFQFDMTGVTIISASGGAAEAAGFMVSASSTTVIGFSLTGSVVEAGTGVLTVLEIEGDPASACIENIILSDTDGGSLDTSIEDCLTIVHSGCFDEDGDGICDDVDDCVGEYDECGECNGDGIDPGFCDCEGNVEDCLGECGGDAVEDCAGECGGDAVEDCAGECGGDAVEDECGECNGDGPAHECWDGSFACDASECPDLISTIDILYDTPFEIGGFQFNIDVEGLTILGVSGGVAEEVGFMVSAGATTVIGFSLTGDVIPAGTGVLTQVEIEGNNPEEACLSEGDFELVVSDPSGAQLYSWVDNCLTINCNLPDPPLAPENLTASVNGNDVTLAWDASDNADGYNVFQDGTLVDMTSGNSSTVIDLSYSTTYAFCVSAYNDGGDSDQACIDATTDDAPAEPLIAPENLMASASDSEVHLTWDGPPGEVAGVLQINITADDWGGETTWELTNSSGEVIAEGGPLGNNSENTWDIDLEADTYVWTIFDAYGDGICCGYGIGGYQLLLDGVEIANGGEFGEFESVEFTVEGMVLSIATGYYSEPHGYEKGEIPENWQNLPVDISIQEFENINRDLLGYNVYRSDFSGLGYFLIGSTSLDETSYDDETVTNESTYFYVVTAVYDGGESDFSNEASATPMPYIPDPASDLVAVAGDGQVDLSWESPGGSGGFPPCPDGSAEYVDCAGVCFNNSDCADATYDGCVEGDSTWLGDGFCDDGSWNLVFWLPGGECPEYGNDCGDCEALDDPLGICSDGGGGGGDCTSIDNFSVVSPEECYESSNYFDLSWEGGCELTALYFGENDVQENYFDVTGYGFDATLLFYGFGPNETYLWQVEAGDITSDVVTATSSSLDCGGDLADYGVRAKAELPPDMIKHFDPNSDHYNVDREELTGFNVYRSEMSGEPYDLIGATDAETTEYSDGTVVNGTTYFYVVTSVYDDDIESPYSNEDSATPMSTVVLGLTDADVVSGDNVIVTLSMDNVEDVGGIQVDLSDVPDFLTVVNVSGSERVPEDWMLSASEQDNGSSRLLGFSLEGTIIAPGSGAIVDIEFASLADHPEAVSLCTTEEVFANPDGLPFFADSDCSTVNVSIAYNISLGLDVITESADLYEEVAVDLSFNTNIPIYEFDLRVADNPSGVDFNAADAGDALPDGWSLNSYPVGAEYRIIGSAGDGSSPLEGSGVFVQVFGLVADGVLGGDIIVSYGASNVSDMEGNNYFVESYGSDTFEVYPGFLPAPMNLTAESGLDNMVPLEWQGIPDPVWISYDSGLNEGNSIGTGAAADIDVAIMFEQAQLSDYLGMSISKVKFVPLEESCSYSVRIWHGTTLVLDQSVPDPIIGDWNEITLDQVVSLPSTGPLYIGYNANTTTGYPAGCDEGPAVAGYGDLIRLGGGTWESMAELYALDYNWNLAGYLVSPFGQTAILEPIDNPTPLGITNGILSASGVMNPEDTFHGMTMLPDSDSNLYNIWTDGLSRDLNLTGYNIYRSDNPGFGYELIDTNDAGDTMYDDYFDLTNGFTYYYAVTSVYDDMNESEYSNVAEATPMSWLSFGLSGGEVQGGDEITLTFSMDNDDDVAGIQFDLVDVPDNLYFISLNGTERVPEDWLLNGNDQDAGNARILGFSMEGTLIEAGSGPIVEVTFGSLASEPVEVEVCTANETFANPDGNPFPLESVCSNVSIDVESVNASITTWTDPVDQGDTFSVTVSIDSPFPIYGFQLEIEDNPEAVTAIDVQPSELVEDVGGMFQWSELNDYMNALWFTLDLEAIETSGDLFTITYQVNEDAEDGLTDICFRSQSVFSDENGSSIYAQYDCSTAIIGVPDILLSLEQTSETTYDVLMDNVGEVAGIQFSISDNPDVYSYISAETTDRIPGDWMVSGSDVNGEVTVVGFSLAGSTIDAGDGAIVSITVDNSVMEDMMVDMCFETAIFSDPDANPWYVAGECAEFTIPFGPSEVTQDITIDALQFNMLSFNVVPENPAIADIFGDAGVLLGTNDDGNFFAPDFGVNQIGDMNLSEGYKIFINGMVDQSVSITGAPVDASASLLIEAFKTNLLPYLPQMGMASSDAFGPHDQDILLVANDSGDFYVPSFGVFSLDMLNTGEAYSIFLSGANDIDFTYPASGLARIDQEMNEYYASCESEHYSPIKTGIPYPVILTGLNGHIDVGDEIAAYANGELVGAVKVMDMTKPAVITAWAGYQDHSINLPGFIAGDEIELRVWDSKQNREIRVESNLSNTQYGIAPLTSGSIIAFDMLAIPDEYMLSQNYPNPFNPGTTIEFSLPSDSYITLNIYDITGRLVNTLVNGSMETGYHTVTWNGIDSEGRIVSAGLYIYALNSKDVSITRKMVLMK